jgi:hypothetical protein
MSPLYLPICGITLPFQSKFACATSKNSNEHLFCVPGPLMERQGAVSIFHAKRVILMMSVYSLVLAREGLVIGMPSPIIKNAK